MNVPSMVPEIYLGSDSSSPSYLTVFNNELFLPTTVTEMNCGSMMELMLQVRLRISMLEVSVVI